MVHVDMGMTARSIDKVSNVQRRWYLLTMVTWHYVLNFVHPVPLQKLPARTHHTLTPGGSRRSTVSYKMNVEQRFIPFVNIVHQMKNEYDKCHTWWLHRCRANQYIVIVHTVECELWLVSNVPSTIVTMLNLMRGYEIATVANVTRHHTNDEISTTFYFLLLMTCEKTWLRADSQV